MSYPAYESYKDSGEPWIGDIPKDWISIKLGHYLTSLKDGTHGTHERVNEGPYLLSAKNVQDDELIYSDLDSKITEEEFLAINKNGSFKFGDVLLTIVGTIGRCAIYPKHEEKVAFQRSVATLRPVKKVYNRYLMYSLQADSSQKQLLSKAKQSAQLGVYLSDVATMKIAIPALHKQVAIAAFLDEKTAAIDDLIAKKETLLELLSEKRTALITHAVTKGLNLSAPMKPSGINWIGDVPQGWETIKLRFLCRINTGSRDTENRIAEAEYPFFVRSQTIERIDTYALDCEAVLTAGDGVGVGKVFHYYNGKFDFHQRVYAFTDFYKIQGKFFFQFFSQFFGLQMNIYSAKSTVDSVRRPFLQELIMCVPPEEEQTKIVEFLEKEIVKFDKMEKAVQEAVSKLKEYRIALITNAVTGKIKVV